MLERLSYPTWSISSIGTVIIKTLYLGGMASMNMHYIHDINGASYQMMLEHLGKECDYFSLVEPIIDSVDFPEEIPPTKASLLEFLMKKNRVTSWPGTKIKVAKESKKAVEHIFKCCKSSLCKLYDKDSFYDIEYQMDIAFFKDNQCILFTISHERIMMADLDFWGDFFNKVNAKTLKANNFD